ncbi:MAG: polyprenol monophosphomannose synthase [Actinobacteria bacterium]|nr:polyprenol monophosphomannose synthase [Actinomycetota bacterium]
MSDGGPTDPKTLVIVPTYNERESLPVAVAAIAEHCPGVDVLVVDDNSPDGTGQLADDLARHDSRVSVLHRPGKQGLGVAYIAGFQEALNRGYELIVEMDADGSHRAADLKILLEVATGSPDVGLVLGSRWVRGGTVVNWPVHRLLLSRGGNLYTRMMLRLPVADATGGFRVFRAQTLRQLDLSSIQSAGYCFQVDMTRRVHKAGIRIREVPITFVERALGYSKMSNSIVREALWRVTVWGFQDLMAAVTRH